MTNNKHAIILFLKDGISPSPNSSDFPFTPEEIWNDGYSFNFINYINEPCADIARMDAEAECVYVPHIEIKSPEQIMNIVASAINAKDMQDKLIYTVHPNSILLPLYRWFLIKEGMSTSYIDVTIQKLSRRVVDLCEAFYKPTILSLERRQSFSCDNISFWLSTDKNVSTSNKEKCLNVIKYLCHKL
jgi:hypothetical protein